MSAVFPGPGFVGIVTLAAATVASVLVGRSTWWRNGLLRLLMVVLNVFAALVLVLHVEHVVNRLRYPPEQQAQSVPSAVADQSGGQPGIYSDGHWVSNIYAYDASGKPLVGVQLFDQTGKPLNVVRMPECQEQGSSQWDAVPGYDASGDGQPASCAENGFAGQARVSYPWTNGAAQLDNVFPLPTALQDSFAPDPNAFSAATPPQVGPFPMASAPSVSLPGITPSVQQVPAPPKVAGSTKTTK
jgi:hypothetical protein